jgi:Fe-S-cluster containining protein
MKDQGSVLSVPCVLVTAVKSIADSFRGGLIPSDLQRIADYIGSKNLVDFAIDNLLASPGAIVADQGRIRRIRTLVPARRRDGACHFLDEKDRCRIHSVSPYNCSYFDVHQSKEESDRRSLAGLHQVDLDWQNDQTYSRLWLLLNTLGRTAPPPEDARARMQAAIETSDHHLLHE